LYHFFSVLAIVFTTLLGAFLSFCGSAAAFERQTERGGNLFGFAFRKADRIYTNLDFVFDNNKRINLKQRSFYFLRKIQVQIA